MAMKSGAATKNHEAFTGIIGALTAVYEAEILRLAAETYRERILMGEFSGDASRDGGPAHKRLEDELEGTHPWTKDVALARAVLAVSGWGRNENSTIAPGSGLEVGLTFDAGLAGEVAECMAHDILAVAVSRGWVRGYKRLGPSYLLKVA